MSESKFSEFVSDFNTFKDENNLTISYVDSRGYCWRIGENVKSSFSTHLENEWPDAPEVRKQEFKNIFETGNDMLGIPIAGTCSGDYSNTIYLLKATEKKNNTTINDVSFKVNKNIFDKTKVKCPITNQLFYMICYIKLNSISINDSSDTYNDEFSGNYKGNILNSKYSSNKIQNNDNNGVSMYGTIDYKNCNINISRSSDKNIVLLEQLIAELSSPSSGGSSSGSSTSTPAPAPVEDSDNLKINFTTYENPLNLIWKFSIV